MSPKRIAATVVKIAVTAGLFLLLFRPQTFGLRADLFGAVTPRDMLRELQDAGARNVAIWLLLGAAIKLCGMLAGVLRWRLLLHGQGVKIPFWYTVQSWFIGRYIGIFLPGTLGLDGYRLYDSCRYSGEIIKCTTVIAIEKLTGFIALTGLVFLTFPLGFHLLRIKIPVLAVTLGVLGCAVVFFFLLLLTPRVIQVLVAVVPAPAGIRGKLNKLGAAATAYSGSRWDLFLAVLLGLLVHVATCFMFFCTMTAIRAENTSMFDIFFASPLMIYATVLGPSIGGEGIREIVFVSLLAGTSGAAAALTFAHLGWWVGDVTPFLIGGAMYIFRARPSKDEMTATLAETRRKAAASGVGEGIHLTHEQVAQYRRKLIDCVLAGAFGGLIGGALTGISEASWIWTRLENLGDAGLFWWGPLAYGLLFAGLGLALSAALAFLYLLRDRFFQSGVTFALSLGGVLAAGALVIGRFRFQRDILAGHPLTLVQNLSVLAVAAGAGLLAAAITGAMASRVRLRRTAAIAAGLGAYALLILAGAAWSGGERPAVQSAPPFSAAKQSAGPNIVFVAVDALRADYLPAYSPRAAAATPNLDTFRGDAVFFPNCFAQSTWTKPSFATLFTGLYPETHTAVTKTSRLPSEIVTLAEALRDGGYYTKGLANNPNIMKVWNFDQGFVDYTDLKPSVYYFWAPASAEKLCGYNGLRLVRQRLCAISPLPDKGGFSPKKLLRRLRERVFGKGLVVTEFYQPAEVVTQDALDWIDSRAVPQGTPFYLFLHYMDPHDPFMDADRAGVGYARVQVENPPPELKEPMQKAYNDEIEHLDKYLGALFAGLKQRGLYDGALIVFTSDHGEEFLDHQGWWHGQTLYDELMHVPLIAKLPGNARAASVNGYLARHVDVAPTLLHFAGVEKPAAMQGLSLFGPDNADANAATSYVYAHVDFENNVLRGARTSDAKLVYANPDNPRHTPAAAFYDLKADAAEQTNLSGTGNPRQADEVALTGTLEGMGAFVRENAAEPKLEQGVSADIQNQLESLGYLK